MKQLLIKFWVSRIVVMVRIRPLVCFAFLLVHKCICGTCSVIETDLITDFVVLIQKFIVFINIGLLSIIRKATCLVLVDSSRIHTELKTMLFLTTDFGEFWFDVNEL